MSTIPKHFGLTAREESYMFKELEKIRQKTKKDYEQLRQRLAARPTLKARYEDQEKEERPGTAGGSGEKKGHVSWAAKPSSGAQSGERPAAADLQGAPHSARGSPGKPQRFSPRDFYMRSSAFRRHPPYKEAPAIAPQVGTTRPVILLRPRSRRKRLREKGRGAPVTTRVSKGRAQESPVLDVTHTRYRLASSLSSLSSDIDDSARLRRLRIRTHFQRDLVRWHHKPSSRSRREGSSASQGTAPLLGIRYLPKNIEEIIASLQSEAQQASDQTIKELIQSILGQNYDIAMEDISLMEQMYLRPSQVQFEVPKEVEEKNFPPSITEHPVVPSIYEELPETVSSIFQVEQEEAMKWVDRDENIAAFKSQETLDIVPPEDDGKPLDSALPTTDAKLTSQPTLKVEPRGFMQIRGREVKPTYKSRPKKLPKPRIYVKPEDKKLIKKIPQAHLPSHLHDLCTTVPTMELPVDLYLASRVYHTPDRKGHKAVLGLLGLPLLGDHCVDEQRERLIYGVPVMSEKQKYTGVTSVPAKKFPEPEQTNQWEASKANLQLSGEEVSAYPGISKMFWNLSAPKFALPESTIRETLYPKYESVQTSRLLTEKLSVTKETEIIVNTSTKRSFKNLIIKKSASYENIQTYSSAPYTRLKRSKSKFELRKEETPLPFIMKDDIDTNLEQLKYQKKKELEHQLAKQRISFNLSRKDSLESLQGSEDMKILSMSLIEASRKAGITYVVFPSKKKKLLKKGTKFQKMAHVYEKLSGPPKKIQRSASHGVLPGERKYFLKVPLYERQIRCPSVPTILNFDKFAESRGGIPKNTDPWTWVLELFAKDKPRQTHTAVASSAQEDVPEPVIELSKLELSDHVKCNLPPEVIKYYESEVEKLTQEIKSEKRNLAFVYCRRGAIYRKLGKLQSAMNDLQEAIFQEPFFLNAYWHRHFIYLFQDKVNDALDDLNFITKYNKNHAEAYLSKAEIFREKDITLAILNYSQAIKCRPKDADLYFKRGEMYEKTNKVLAIDDYSKDIPGKSIF
ncbi:tetratricopeptide repeat protein 6 isoform X9 [Mus musculus]|uniref:tetratricopeptide repeat protein 6 isoform X9 n=1 Tax=Mus musculus TaxID=10090 RepID=UPI0007ECC7C6|nr:tetratricopeptide repeat protein 6 isoform X9 [Mus musculus]|eukprot:XP_017170681.1 PREDICTED: tetratricopeptide repeat protein 6 isoform X9 [Mus musculus]